MEKLESLGLPGSDYVYHKIDKGQNQVSQSLLTWSFLTRKFAEYAINNIPEIYSEDMSFQFINYGDTQLVYVLHSNGKQYAVLVGQPTSEFGAVRKEYDNLRLLSDNNNPEIVKPIHYFADEDREMYIAPYFHQAGCIASQDIGWGIYVPEPEYHFKKFTSKQRLNVNSSMIALLVKLFDEKRNLGLASCKIGGGDFILEKRWQEHSSRLFTLSHMRLIAARELIDIDLDGYIELIRNEFGQRTYYNNESERDQKIKINHKSREPMTLEEIENGIEIGRYLRKIRK